MHFFFFFGGGGGSLKRSIMVYVKMVNCCAINENLEVKTLFPSRFNLDVGTSRNVATDCQSTLSWSIISRSVSCIPKKCYRSDILRRYSSLGSHNPHIFHCYSGSYKWFSPLDSPRRRSESERRNGLWKGSSSRDTITVGVRCR